MLEGLIGGALGTGVLLVRAMHLLVYGHLLAAYHAVEHLVAQFHLSPTAQELRKAHIPHLLLYNAKLFHDVLDTLLCICHRLVFGKGQQIAECIDEVAVE